MKISIPFAALAALLSLGCSSETLFKSNRKVLDDAWTALGKKDLETAVQRSEAVVVRTGEDPSPYVLQRFFGAFVAAQAHLAAASEGAFLEDTRADTSVIHLGDAASALDEPDIAVGHLVAAMYHASLGIEWLPRAEKAPLQAEKQPVLPQPFEELGAENAGINLVLSQIAVFSRLGFQGRVDRLLRQSGLEALQQHERCKQIAEGVQLRPWVLAWLYYAMFDFLKKDNAIAAYPFAVEALALGNDSLTTFPRKALNQVEDWVVKNPDDYEWVCSCGNTSPPSLTRCVHCQRVPVMEFRARKKPTQATQ